VHPHATVIIPLDDRIIVVGLLNCAEFSCWFSKVAQTFDAISGIQLLAGGSGLGERRPFGSVRIRRCPGVRERRLGSLTQFGWLVGYGYHISIVSFQRGKGSLLCRDLSSPPGYSVALERIARLVQTAQFWEMVMGIP
jgi:hypothetical protein